MNAKHNFTWNTHSDAWVLSLNYFPEIGDGSFVSSNSSGSLSLYQLNNRTQAASVIKAHSASINATNKVNKYSLASASSDGVKLWDLRQKLDKPVVTLTGGKYPNYLSLGSKDGLALAAGTELAGCDAEIHMWDLRNADQMLRSFVDSHHDDVTDLKFHNTLPYLMSGSTDGCVNVYNLNEPDEDEALHQAINFASVHLCQFTQPNRIAILSHVESLGFWDLNSTDYESNTEAAPKELGDVRSIWPDCEYVVDLYQDFAVYGANLNRSLSLLPFNPHTEEFDLNQRVFFDNAHGEDVVRDICVLPGGRVALTCGEDGLIKSWDIPYELSTSTPKTLILDSLADNEMAEPIVELKKDKKQKDEKSKDKKKKDKKDKKRKKDNRFRPY